MEEIGGQGEHQGPTARERSLCLKRNRGTSREREEGAARASLPSDFHRQER
ncbi:hypothetical protein [Paenibacillus polysaccharolyticus]|uniref:hypothetical protein n=1 Tax=Paenibacillus polysaccharolyticus TaxID=582692 RepID=UPI00300ABEDF